MTPDIVYNFYRARERFLKAVTAIVVRMIIVFWLGYFIFGFVTNNMGLGFIGGWALLLVIYRLFRFTIINDRFVDYKLDIKTYLSYLKNGTEQIVYQILIDTNKTNFLKGIFSNTDIMLTEEDLSLIKQIIEEGSV
jgi:hypothetical protein